MARIVHVAQFADLDLHLHSCFAKEQKDALDNLWNSFGFVDVGNGNLVHRFGADSHPFSRCGSSNGNPPDSGTQACRLITSIRRRHGGAGRRMRLEVAGEEKHMPLVNIVIALIVVGVALWLINTYIPMAGSIKAILNVVVVVAVAVWVLQAVGLWGRITGYKLVN
jgi:hypothetical protein